MNGRKVAPITCVLKPFKAELHRVWVKPVPFLEDKGLKKVRRFILLILGNHFLVKIKKEKKWFRCFHLSANSMEVWADLFICVHFVKQYFGTWPEEKQQCFFSIINIPRCQFSEVYFVKKVGNINCVVVHCFQPINSF